MNIPKEAVEAAKRITSAGPDEKFEDRETVARALLDAKTDLLGSAGRLRFEKARAERAEAERDALRQAVREVATHLTERMAIHYDSAVEAVWARARPHYGAALNILREKTAPHMGGTEW